MTHGAGCLCGAVRVSIDAEPLAARQCWCRLCQYLGGGGATVNVGFPSKAVGVVGEMRWFASVADSGTAMRRGFCPICGTPLFSIAESRPQLIFIRAGALDHPGLLAPQASIWVSQAPGWACIDPTIPRHDAQLPPVA